MHLHVHLVQCLLHPLHAARALARQVAQLPVQGPQPRDRFARPERPAQQPATVQQLQPLAVDHVRLAPRHVAQLPRVRQQHLQAARLEQLVHRDPVHVRALHRHRLDALLLQPVGEPRQLRSRHAGIRARWASRPPGRCADPVLTTAQVGFWPRGALPKKPRQRKLACSGPMCASSPKTSMASSKSPFRTKSMPEFKAIRSFPLTARASRSLSAAASKCPASASCCAWSSRTSHVFSPSCRPAGDQLHAWPRPPLRRGQVFSGSAQERSGLPGCRAADGPRFAVLAAPALLRRA